VQINIPEQAKQFAWIWKINDNVS